MSKKKDRPEKRLASSAEKLPKKPLRRFSPLTRTFLVLGLTLIFLFLIGTTLQWLVQSALNRRELSRAETLSKVTSYLQPWDADLSLAPARCARLAGDFDSWSKLMQPFAAQAQTSRAISTELQLGRIQLGEFPDDFHGLMGKMLETSSAGEVAEAFVIGLMAKHDRENARAILDAWKKDEPQSVQVEYTEAIYEELLGNRRESIALFRKFSQAHPTHQPVHRRLADIYLTDRRYDLASTELKILFSQGDHSPSILLKLARCYRLQGDAEEAKKLLLPLTSSKDGKVALRELAACQLELGEYAAAGQSLQDFGIEHLPPADQFDFALADYLSGKPDTAASIYAAAARVRQFQNRRSELEVYLLLNPDDEKARRELDLMNGKQ